MEKTMNKRNEIVNILNHVRLKHVLVYAKTAELGEFAKGYLTKTDTNSISMLFEQVPACLPLKSSEIHFEYANEFYRTPPLSIRNYNGMIKTVEMNLPDELSVHSIRKFTRVNLPGDRVKLAVTSIESPASPEKSVLKDINIDELPPNLKRIYLELLEEEPDLKKVIAMVGEELRRYSTRFRTNIFKDTQNLAPLEKVVYRYKKTFWISETENMNSYVHLGGKYNLIGYEKYFEMINKPVSPPLLEQIRANYLDRGVVSYCLVPVLIGERVAGVIEVTVMAADTNKKLTIYDIFYIKGLADILGEVVVKSRGSGDESDFQVQDISLGGISAMTKNVYLTRSFTENAVAKIDLQLGSETLSTAARVVRCEYVPGETGGLNVAMEFLAMGEQERAMIGKFIRTYLKEKMNKKEES